MPEVGVVSGGWEYVWAAYVLSGLVFLGYFLSVHLRYRSELARQQAASPGEDR